jgi:glycogen operon protein
MVKAYHRAGIEVILDVVYNHTAEGNHMGPTLSFKGIDNACVLPSGRQRPQHYFDTTGTGNSLLMRSPHALQLITDSLALLGGPRCMSTASASILAATLARQFQEVDKLSAFFDIVEQDPVISRVKLIAEPWDLGSGGYQVGGFPSSWSEWNGRYRDVRARLLALATIHAARIRQPSHGQLRPVSDERPPPGGLRQLHHGAHDGFTMNDLVSYNEKHNEANGEGNRRRREATTVPGTAVSKARPPFKDVNDLRHRRCATCSPRCCFSRAYPMICGGDEVAARSRATTMPTARTTNCLGPIGILTKTTSKDLLDFVSRSSFICDSSIRCCTAVASSPAASQATIPDDADSAGRMVRPHRPDHGHGRGLVRIRMRSP